MDIILSTAKLMLPVFWLDVCEIPLNVPAIDWCDSWRSAERSDLTADICINPELSNNFTQEKEKQEVSNLIKYLVIFIVQGNIRITWEFKDERILNSLYWPDVSLGSFETAADASWIKNQYF